MKAIVTRVKLGSLEFQGYRLNDGTFAIAVEKVCTLLNFYKNHPEKGVEDFLGINGTKFFFTYAQPTHSGECVKCINLNEFSQLVSDLAFLGNKAARKLTYACVGLTLTQTFSRAFCENFGETAAQSLLSLFDLEEKRTLKDAIRDYHKFRSNQGVDTYRDGAYLNEEDFVECVYKECHKILNFTVLGRKAPPTTTEECKAVKAIESLATHFTDNEGKEPLAAVLKALDLLY